MVTPTPKETLDALFPLPAVPTVAEGYRPAYQPGHSDDSRKALVKLLKENHERFHIFFNEEEGYHNHCTHHLFAIYTLGAPAKVLEAAFQTHADYQCGAVEPPGEITESNWTEHFGDGRYFRAYVSFFTKAYMKLGLDAVLDKYVFSTNVNWVDSIKDVKKQPQMVNRLLSGVIHPLIHVGYGIEFDSPGMVVEGLAMACVERNPHLDTILPRSWIVGDTLTSRLTSSLAVSPKSTSVHSFSIVAQMMKDSALGPGVASVMPPKTLQIISTGVPTGVEGLAFPMIEVLDERGELIRKYAEQWEVNGNDKNEVQAKLDELSFLVALLYGVAGLQEGKEFKADFFTMHLVTSSLFLPTFIEHLQPTAKSILLRSFLVTCLTVWVARARPAVSIESFYQRTSPSLTPPGPQPTPGKETLTPDALTPNPWQAVLQSTILHPNEHLCKAQRALAQYARIYGDYPVGTFKGTELKDAELLDGTVFVRAAALTMNRLGWLREGQEKSGWDYIGFWY